MTESNAVLCERAARLLNYVGRRATPGPWSASTVDSPDSNCTSAVYNHSPGSKPGDEVVGSSRAKPRKRDAVVGPSNRDGGIWHSQDAQWIALASPVVAAPLAVWLRKAAAHGREFMGGGAPDEAVDVARALLDHAPASLLRYAKALPPGAAVVTAGAL